MGTYVGNAQEAGAAGEAEYLSRKGKGPMDDTEFNAVVSGALMQSVQFVDFELSPERAKATEYYLGKPFGNEEEGRSQVVLTEVRDAVNGIVPSLMRIFFGSENVVEFVPTRADCVEQAAQATDFIRYVFTEDNNGFLQTLSVLKDGLIRKIGIFKWGWDDSDEFKSYKLQGVTEQEMELLAADDDIDIAKAEKTPTLRLDQMAYEKAHDQWKMQCDQIKAQFAQAQKLQAAQPPQPGQPPAPPAQPPQMPPEPPKPPQLHSIELRRTVKGGRARLWSLPPEEFIFNREARDLDSALLVAHRTAKTRGQLIALGVSEEDLAAHAGADDAATDVTLRGNAEELARRDVAGVGRVFGFGYTVDPELGRADDKVLYTEAYITIDYDGDGVAELRKICCIGPQYHPISNDPADERPFAVFIPDPEPHTMLGGSWADRTMDIQRIKSFLLRGTLDSLSASIFPRTIYTEGQASVADILNTAIGAPIRERTPNSVRSFAHLFTGKEVFPFFSLMDDIVERRTGQEKGAQGLDADALQSMDKGGVAAVVSAAQLQTELVARIFAESTFKPLFRGLLRLVIGNQPKTRVVRLRGSWVDVDPRLWDAAMDVSVNVGLGTTFVDKKIAILMQTASEQKDILTQMGLQNPMTSLSQLSNTYAKILELQGFKDATSYFNKVDPKWAPPPTPPPVDPNAAIAEATVNVQKLRTTGELAIQRDKITMEREKNAFDHAIALKKLDDDVVMRKYVADAQFGAQMQQAQLDNALSTEAKETELTMQAHGMLHDQALDRATHEHSVNMDTRAADTADAETAADAASGGAEESAE